MDFKHSKLANGMTIVGEINKSAKSAAVGFFVKTGSRDETEQINGVSHFLEHMLFKGTEKLNALDVNQAFDATGAQFNAFTSEENTVYYAAILPEYMPEVTRLWAQLMRPALRDEDFDIEKNVIKEEIAMYQDMPSFDVIDKCRTLHFDGHPCGYSVLGSIESIDNLTASQMKEYFTDRYVPNNIILACAGNFDWNQVCSIAEQFCGNWQQQTVMRQIIDHSGSKKKTRVENKNLNREHICLMSPAVSVQDPRRYAAWLLSSIIGDDTGSRFFWEIVDKALAESASMQFGPMDGTGVFCSYISCSSENLEKVLDTIKAIFDSLTTDCITEDELKKAENKLLSALVIKNELPMGRLVDLGFNWIYLGEYRTIQQEINAIKTVTLDEVLSLIQELKPGDFTQLSMGPIRK